MKSVPEEILPIDSPKIDNLNDALKKNDKEAFPIELED